MNFAGTMPNTYFELTEALAQKCFVKRVFWIISQNSQNDVISHLLKSTGNVIDVFLRFLLETKRKFTICYRIAPGLLVNVKVNCKVLSIQVLLIIGI